MVNAIYTSTIVKRHKKGSVEEEVNYFCIYNKYTVRNTPVHQAPKVKKIKVLKKTWLDVQYFKTGFGF